MRLQLIATGSRSLIEAVSCDVPKREETSRIRTQKQKLRLFWSVLLASTSCLPSDISQNQPLWGYAYKRTPSHCTSPTFQAYPISSSATRPPTSSPRVFHQHIENQHYSLVPEMDVSDVKPILCVQSLCKCCIGAQDDETKTMLVLFFAVPGQGKVPQPCHLR